MIRFFATEIATLPQQTVNRQMVNSHQWVPFQLRLFMRWCPTYPSQFQQWVAGDELPPCRAQIHACTILFLQMAKTMHKSKKNKRINKRFYCEFSAQALNSKEIGGRLNIIERSWGHATNNVVPMLLRFCFSRGLEFFKCFLLFWQRIICIWQMICNNVQLPWLSPAWPLLIKGNLKGKLKG